MTKHTVTTTYKFNKTQFTVLDWRSCPGCGQVDDTYDGIAYVACNCDGSDGIKWVDEWKKWIVHVNGKPMNNAPCSFIEDAIRLYHGQKRVAEERKRK